MKAKELLHQINNARQMLDNAAEECKRPIPDWKIIFANLSRSRELILEAEFLAGNELEAKKDDQTRADVNAVIDRIEEYQNSLLQQG